MDFNLRPATIVTVLITVVFAGRATGQQVSSPADGVVEQAAFERTSPRDAQQSVCFGRMATRIGDSADQTIEIDLRLTLSMMQANQLIGKSRTTMRTHQRRAATTTEVEAGRSTAVSVRYIEATKQVVAAEGEPSSAPPDVADELTQSPPVPQPVQGKTYLCRREPGEGGKLIVTDEVGNVPPKDELEIVAPQMEVVGRPNPLAQFLGGRTIAVGEKIELPKDVAREIFNLSDGFGEVTRFTLMLSKLQSEGGVPCAVFIASVEAASNDSSQMRLEVQGPLVVQVESCRATRVNLAGPIGMSETRGTYSTAYQVIGTGRLQMSIASAYRLSQQP